MDEPEELYYRCQEIVNGEYDWMEQYYFDLRHIRELSQDVVDDVKWVMDNEDLEFMDAVEEIVRERVW